MVSPGLRVFSASQASFLTRPGTIEASPFVISRREPCASFLSLCGRFYFLEMPESAAAFGADLLSQLKGGTSFASSDPPGASGDLAPIPALVWPGMEVRAGCLCSRLLEPKLRVTLQSGRLQHIANISFLRALWSSCVTMHVSLIYLGRW